MTLLERVARALWEDEYPSIPWDKCAEQEDYRGHARAALEAMREPTEAMIAAGPGAVDDYYNGTKDAPFEESFGPVFRAMIDAALSESK